MSSNRIENGPPGLVPVRRPTIGTIYIPSQKQIPWNSPDDFWLTKSTEDFILRQRTLLSRGWPLHLVLGSNDVDIEHVFHIHQKTIQPASVSQWVALVADMFELLGVPERLALMFVVGRLVSVSSSTTLKWQRRS